MKASNELKENLRRGGNRGSVEKDDFGLYYKYRKPAK